MGSGVNQSITGAAIQRALSPSDAEAAGRMEAAADQAVLDEQDRRDLEHAQYYADPTAAMGLTTRAAGGQGVRGRVLRLTRRLARRG